MDTSVYIPFLTASVLLTLMPGPDIIYVIMLSISKGKKYGIITALGLVAGIIVHTTYIAFGVAALINRSEVIFVVIKTLGALYLFYLAYRSYRQNDHIDLKESNETKKTSRELFRQGFIMNVLNPKVALFFLAFFPGFIVESRGNVTLQIYLLGFLFMFQALVVFIVISVSSAQLTSFLRNNLKFEHFLKWFQVVVFIAIGIFILFSEK